MSSNHHDFFFDKITKLEGWRMAVNIIYLDFKGD